MTGAKKIIKVKNQFFHACQPRELIFMPMPSAFPIFILAVQISILAAQKKFGHPKKFGCPKKNLDGQKNF